MSETPRLAPSPLIVCVEPSYINAAQGCREQVSGKKAGSLDWFPWYFESLSSFFVLHVFRYQFPVEFSNKKQNPSNILKKRATIPRVRTITQYAPVVAVTYCGLSSEEKCKKQSVGKPSLARAPRGRIVALITYTRTMRAAASGRSGRDCARVFVGRTVNTKAKRKYTLSRRRRKNKKKKNRSPQHNDYNS